MLIILTEWHQNVFILCVINSFAALILCNTTSVCYVCSATVYSNSFFYWY